MWSTNPVIRHVLVYHFIWSNILKMVENRSILKMVVLLKIRFVRPWNWTWQTKAYVHSRLRQTSPPPTIAQSKLTKSRIRPVTLRNEQKETSRRKTMQARNEVTIRHRVRVNHSGETISPNSITLGAHFARVLVFASYFAPIRTTEAPCVLIYFEHCSSLLFWFSSKLT